MTQQIRALFNPASIAVVGATDKSGWSVNTLANLRRHGFGGPVHLVNPRTEIVHGEDMESLEINPLLGRGSRIEALDALVTWRTWARCEADTPNQRR
jgi:predicted CoA-binding protein